MIKHQRIFGWAILSVLLLSLTVSCKKDTPITETPKKDSQKQLLSFKVDSISGQINESSHTVTVQVPYATDLVHAKPVVAVSEKARVSPLSGVEVDLSKPVTYNVTAEDGSVQAYTVTASKGQNTEAKILEFKLDARSINGFFYTGTIDEATHTIIVGIPYPFVNRTKLPFAVKISEGATIIPAATDTLDFTGPVGFTVSAQSGARQVYIVKVLNNYTRTYFETPFVSVYGASEGYRGNYSKPVGATAYPEDTLGIATPLFVVFPVLETENVSNMVFHKITLPEGATLSPGVNVPQNFNNDVIYTITAQTGEKLQCTVRMLKKKLVVPEDFQQFSPRGIQTGGVRSSIHYVANSDATQVWLVNTNTNATYNCTLSSAARGAQGDGYITFIADEAIIPRATILHLKVKLANGSEVLTHARWILD